MGFCYGIKTRSVFIPEWVVADNIAKRENIKFFLEEGCALRTNAFQEFYGSFEVAGQFPSVQLAKHKSIQNLKFRFPFNRIHQMHGIFLHIVNSRSERIVIHFGKEINGSPQKVGS